MGDLDELDELIDRYVFSVNFDCAAQDERAAIHEWVTSAILAERQRCADVADKWAKDDIQSGEARLAAAYIRREIVNPSRAT